MARIDGEPVYDCSICSDSGLVWVVNPRTIDEFEFGIEPREVCRRDDSGNPMWSHTEDPVIRGCTTRCSCKHGDIWHNRGRWSLPQYDPAVYCKIDGIKSKDKSAIESWLAEHGKREQAFLEWNSKE